jgi:hypothetical protein
VRLLLLRLVVMVTIVVLQRYDEMRRIRVVHVRREMPILLLLPTARVAAATTARRRVAKRDRTAVALGPTERRALNVTE